MTNALAFQKGEFVIALWALRRKHRADCKCGQTEDVMLIVASRKPSGLRLAISFTNEQGLLGAHVIKATDDQAALVETDAWIRPVSANPNFTGLDRLDVMSADLEQIAERLAKLDHRFGALLSKQELFGSRGGP